MIIYFDIPGKAQGKGRPRFTATGHAYTPQATRDYEKTVAQNYMISAKGHKFTGPVEIAITVFIGIPKNTSIKKARELYDKPCPKKPDIDNVVKIICDGLNKVAYDDDNAVTKITAHKRYTGHGNDRVHVRMTEHDDYYYNSTKEVCDEMCAETP